jgi:hypothetical protein
VAVPLPTTHQFYNRGRVRDTLPIVGPLAMQASVGNGSRRLSWHSWNSDSQKFGINLQPSAVFVSFPLACSSYIPFSEDVGKMASGSVPCGTNPRGSRDNCSRLCLLSRQDLAWANYCASAYPASGDDRASIAHAQMMRSAILCNSGPPPATCAARATAAGASTARARPPRRRRGPRRRGRRRWRQRARRGPTSAGRPRTSRSRPWRAGTRRT